MRFRECMSKNAGVAGYVKAFWHVLSESQTGQCINYLLFAVLDLLTKELSSQNKALVEELSAEFIVGFKI